MKLKRGLILSTLLIFTLLVTNLFDVASNRNRYSNSYPSVVCPPNPAGVTTLTSVDSTATPFVRVGGKSTKLVKVKTLRYSSVSDAIVLQSEGTTPISFQSRKGVWAGAVLCSAPSISQWLVGGTSDVSSKGKVYLVNSGLSTSVVDISTWSEKGEQGLKTITVKANSTTSVKLDSLAPGDSEIVLSISARSGRVSAFMIDERGEGLKKLGGDTVNSIAEPSKRIVIAGIPQQLVAKKSPNHYLRLFVPGEADANITLELISSDGRFIPVGFSERRVASSKVVSIKFKPKVAAGAFAVVIKSDQPLVAAVRSRATSNGRSDFVWSTPAKALVPLKMAIGGISPKLTFVGDSIAVNVAITKRSGKVTEKTITGSDLLTWQVPDRTIALEIKSAGLENYAGALVAANSGYAFFPIQSGTELTKAVIPSSNIQVLNP